MSNFNSAKPPVFFDKSGKRWLTSKIIFGLVFINLAMIGILTFNYYNSIGSFNRINSITSSWINQITPAKASDTQAPSAIFSILNPSTPDNYNQYRINEKKLNYLLCSCYKFENNNITSLITSDVQKVLDYTQFKKTSIDPLIQQNIPVNALLPLSQELLDNPRLADIVKNFQIQNRNFLASEIVLDLVANNLNQESANIIKLVSLKNRLEKQNIKLSLITTGNQSQESLDSLQLLSSTLYIQPMKRLASGDMELNWLPKNLAPVINSNPTAKIAIIYPTTHSLQSNYNKEKTVKTINNSNIGEILKTLPETKRQVLFKDNQPYIEYETKEVNTKISNKLLISNEWLYYNFDQALNSMGIDTKKLINGTDNIGASTASSIEFFSTKDTLARQSLIADGLKFDNAIQKITDKVGSIQEIKIPSNQNIQSNLTFTTDYLSKVDIKSLPEKPELKQNQYQLNKISLSFEGGPDSYYTPKILDLLKQNNLKANFFVTGDNTAAHPKILERIAKEGHLIGNQTLSFIDIEKTDNQTLKKEIDKTNEIIEKTVLLKATYFRTPYNLLKDFGHQWQVQTLKTIQDSGLKNSETELTINEKDAPTPELTLQILQSSAKNQVSFLGFNQVNNAEKYYKTIQTHIEAYQKINKDKKLGLEFVTMEVLDNQDKNPKIDPELYTLKSITTPTNVYRYLKTGHIDFTVNYKSINYFVAILNWILLILSVAGIIRLISLVIGNIIHFLTRKQRLLESSDEFFRPPVSMIIPLFNEEKVIINTVNASLKSQYPEFEVIVVDDGSKDNSLQVLRDTFGNNPRVTILTKPNGGKSMALNYGIEHAKYDIVCCMDADTFFAPDTVEKLVKPLINPRVGGVAGSVQIANDYFFMKARSRELDRKVSFFKHFRLVNVLQRLEYTAAQIFDKVAYSSLNSIAVVPGPIGAWRKSLIQEVGGYQTDTLAEDTNLTLDIIAKGYIIKYVQDAHCFTEAPETWNQLWKQRVRWTFGTMQALWKNKFMLLNPKYGWIGFLAYPHAIFSYLNLAFFPVALLMIGSLMFRYFLQSQDPVFVFTQADKTVLQNVIIYFVVFSIIDFAITLYSVILDKSIGKKYLILFLPLVNTVYKTFMFFVLIESILKIFRGKAVGWGHLTRTGSGTPALTKAKNPI